MSPQTQTIDESKLASLVDAALAVRQRAHAPYSHFLVGAALLSRSGETYVGCNVENASFSLTICAERVAAGTAIANGQANWVAVAVASRGGVTPCGACRQFLAEFGNDLLVICIDSETKATRRYQLFNLLPHAFDKTSL
jgi:cytidine deaminase